MPKPSRTEETAVLESLRDNKTCDHVLTHTNERGNHCPKCGLSMSDVLDCVDLKVRS